MHLERDVHDEKSENGDNPFLFADLSVRVVYSRRQYERGTMNNTKENKPLVRYFFRVVWMIELDYFVEDKRVCDEIDPKK